MESDIGVVALAVVAFGMLAGRLNGTPVTMPMVCTGAGWLLPPAMPLVALALVAATLLSRTTVFAAAEHHRMSELPVRLPRGRR